MKIKDIRKSKGISQEQAAKDLGLSVRALQNYEYGQREPSLDVLKRMAQYYSVTTDYLLEIDTKQPNPIDQLSSEQMEKDMLESYFSLEPKKRAAFLEVLVRIVQNGMPKPEQPPTAQIRTILRKCFDDAASAGTGEYLQGSDFDMVCIVETPEALRSDFVVRIAGDSMEPTYHDGELVLVEACDELEEGEIGIFRHEGQGYIKEYSEAGLISHNPEYPIIPENELTDCQISGKVLGVAELAE